MIPIRLELTNFLSYRDTAVLDFNSLHLACITGPNGAGKSSILDAMTWALFGKSRSRSDDDLVNRVAAAGGETAEVRFTFRLEDSIYRVIRQKKARGTSTLELQMQTAEGNWKPLSEGKLRETQSAVEQLLRMNFDTFTNASFLLQGKADEFTTKTPNRRKEILAELLGVTEWERYKEAAVARRKTAEGRVDLLDARCADIEAELAQEAERQAALDAAEAERDGIVARLRQQETLLTQMRKTAEAIAHQQQAIVAQEQQVGRTQARLDAARRTHELRQREYSAIQETLAESEQISADYAAWQTYAAGLQEWRDKADAYNRLHREKEPLQTAIARAESQLDQQKRSLEARRDQVIQLDAERETTASARATAVARRAEIEALLADIARQESALFEERSRLQRLEGERELLGKERQQLEARAGVVQSTTMEKAAVRKTRQDAQEHLDVLNENLAAAEAQTSRHNKLLAERDSLLTSQPGLREEMELIRERMEQLKAANQATECPLCGQPLSKEHRTAVLADLQADGTRRGDRYRTNQDRLKKIDVELKQLTASMQQREKLEKERQAEQERLVRAEAQLEEIARTSQEWQAGGALRLVELVTRLSDQTQLEDQRARVHALETAVAPAADLRQEQQAIQQRIAAAEARLVEIERQQREWAAAGRKQLAQVEEQLAAGNYAPEEQAALQALNARITAVGYDEAAHQELARLHGDLADAPARYQQLKQMEAAAKPLADAIADLEQSIAGLESELGSQQEMLAGMQANLDAQLAGSGDLRGVEDEVFTLRDAEIAANQRVGAARQRVDVLARQREQVAQLQAEKDELALHIQRLRTLEKAFGREGVQSLLIEQAVPEIEEHANALLDRLTGGEMRVSFETQRQLKSRDELTETLDISIADREGERPYDNYSGGEQFRVNFAIRLALSQLLARRAGARLQTLVIDEGFGSQDPIGRQRLVEAINTIQDDFACVLVITHIEELKDAFPSRIEVTKGLTGSHIQVD